MSLGASDPTPGIAVFSKSGADSVLPEVAVIVMVGITSYRAAKSASCCILTALGFSIISWICLIKGV